MAKKWILPKLMRAVDQKPGYNLEWPKQEQFLRVHAHAPEAYLENIQVPCIYSSECFDLAATTHAATLSAECKSKNVWAKFL